MPLCLNVLFLSPPCLDAMDMDDKPLTGKYLDSLNLGYPHISMGAMVIRYAKNQTPTNALCLCPLFFL